MKKLIASLMVVVLCLSLCACGESNFGETHSEVTEMYMVRPVILVPKNTEVFVSYIA